MILVDSSVWIDYFNGVQSSQTDWLDSSLGSTPVIIGDLILTEVLQGFQNEKDFKIAKDLLLGIPFMAMVEQPIALESAMNYRYLRKKGVTVRKTIDVIIGTFCIYNQITLLHCDRDFDPMVKYLGLEIINV
ncbi:MAG: Ribonuclease VapC15 [Syntrophorhabdaceae bacterium]|nr:Ribonuclease VapC15 [Syntrophorhabdaceae bacterium]